MHELSLARALLSQVTSIARSHRAGRVRTVRVSVGEFSGVDADLLQSAFDQVSSDTCASGAEWIASRVPLQARCSGCGYEFDVEAFRFICPACRRPEIEIVRGEELVLESVTLDEALP